MRKSRLLILLLSTVVISLLVLSMVACGEEGTTTTGVAGPGTTAEPPMGDPIKIGVLLDLTGFLAWTGTDNQKGMELALELAGNQVAGHPIELIIEDAASDGAIATEKARKLVETDDVCMVLGPVNGMGDEAITVYMEQQMRPRVELAPTEELVAGGGYEWNFMPHGAGSMYGYAVADYAYNDLGYRSIAGLAAEMHPGHTFLGGFMESFRALGGTTPYETYYPAGTTTDFLPFFASIPEVDCVATWWPGTDGLSGFPQYMESGLTYPMIQPEDGGLTADPKALADLPSAEGCVAGTLYTYLLDTEGNADFVAAFEAKEGTKPGVFAGTGYATMQYILAALEATNGDTTPEALKAALKAADVETVCGRCYFPVAENNISLGRIVIMKVNSDLAPETIEIVNVKEEHDSSGAPVFTVVE